MDTICIDSFLDICNFLDHKSLRNMRATNKQNYNLITKKFGISYEDFVKKCLNTYRTVVRCPLFDGLENVLQSYIEENTKANREVLVIRGSEYCSCSNIIGVPFTKPQFYMYGIHRLFRKKSIGTVDHIILFIKSLSSLYIIGDEFLQYIKSTCKITIFTRSNSMKRAPYYVMNLEVMTLPFLMTGDCLSRLKLILYKTEKLQEVFTFCNKLKPRSLLGLSCAQNKFFNRGSRDIVIRPTKFDIKSLYAIVMTFKTVVKKQTIINIHIVCNDHYLSNDSKYFLDLFRRKRKIFSNFKN